MDVAATTTRRRHESLPPGYRLVPIHELVPQLRFPPGFRFVPTDDELVDFYLRAKIDGRRLPLDVVNEVSILDWQPGRLVEVYKGYGENRWFFFTVREQSSSNKEKEPSRKVRVRGVTATWKATGSVQAIWRKAKDGDGKKKKKEKVGSKRVLIYNSSDAEENGKWSMHEYILQGHDQIGQYALYSIQRKQHSDTEDIAGNGDMDAEKKKKTRKKKRTEKPCTEPEGLQLQHPHPETTTLLAEPPSKPTRKKAKAQRKKKPSLQVEVEVVQQQQGQSPMGPVTPPKKGELVPSSQQELRPQPAAADGAPAPAPVVLSAVPLQAVRECPPSEPSQQEPRPQPPPPPADGAPAPVVLSAVPLQAVRECPPSESEPNGALGGAPAPATHEEDTSEDWSEFLALVWNCNHHPGMLCNCNNQGLEPSLAMGGTTTEFLAAPYTKNVVDHAPFQQPYQQEEDGYYSLFGVHNKHLASGVNQSAYMEQEWEHPDLYLMDNITQPMNSDGGWGWGNNWDDQLHQIHHQQQQQDNNGGGFGVVDQQPMNHPHGGHDLPPVNEQSSGSDDLFFGARGIHVDELEAFVRGELVPRPQDEPLQDLTLAAGTQEQEKEQERRDDPATTLQAAGMQGQWADDTVNLQSLQQSQRLDYWQVQCAGNEYVQNGPCSSMVCAPGP